MNRLFRWYNQNRRTFWIAIGTVIAVIAMVRTLNNYAKRVRETEEKSSSSNTTTYSAIYDNPNYSVITKQPVMETNVYGIENTIDSFVNYCNIKDIEKAYNMLSNDCKKNFYKTKEEFANKYLNVYFKTKKEVKFQAWIIDDNKTVYRVEFNEDLLATGGSNSKQQEDYFTLVNEEGSYKLNINKYIGHEEINKEVFQNNVKIKVLSKEVYLENVLYNIKIENFSNNIISFNEGNQNNSIMLIDANGLKYTAATWELLNSELVVKAKSIENVTIKFLREYKPKFAETRIEFNNINLNYGKGTNKTAIKIELD